MEIRVLTKDEYAVMLELVWRVFNEYEAVDYPESGREAFWQAIHDEAYLDGLKVYGAFDGEVLSGIIAMRNEGAHVALFFVDGEYQRRGIGRRLFARELSESKAERITVHSSLYAEAVYKKLGFAQAGAETEDGGIRYIPMVYKRTF